MSRYPPHLVLLSFNLLLSTVACAGDGVREAGTGWTVTRDTLEGGVLHLVNAAPAEGARESAATIETELRIGTLDGDGAAQFGQILGIAPLSDGRIAVLDAFAREVRLFGADGGHLATYGRQGAGPGELESPFGLMRDDQDRLWVPDHRNNRMTVFDPDSGYVASYRLTVMSRGFVWDGAMLDDGRVVKPSITLHPERRDLLRIYDRRMELVDSILLPLRDEPANPKSPPGVFYWEAPGGLPRGYHQIPFYPRGTTTLDPAGHVWRSHDGEPIYRVARTSLRGDTTLVLERSWEPVPVPEAERDSAIGRIRKDILEYGGTIDQDWSRVPGEKAPIEQLFVSDDGQLWVRTASRDSLIRFDIFERDGVRAGSAATRLPLVSYLAPIVRGDRMWGVVRDESDVEYVVRARMRAARDDPTSVR